MVAKTISLLKKICGRRVSLGSVFMVKTLSVSRRPTYLREMKTYDGNFWIATIFSRMVSLESSLSACARPRKWRERVSARALILPLCREYNLWRTRTITPEPGFPGSGFGFVQSLVQSRWVSRPAGQGERRLWGRDWERFRRNKSNFWLMRMRQSKILYFFHGIFIKILLQCGKVLFKQR